MRLVIPLKYSLGSYLLGIYKPMDVAVRYLNRESQLMTALSDTNRVYRLADATMTFTVFMFIPRKPGMTLEACKRNPRAR